MKKNFFLLLVCLFIIDVAFAQRKISPHPVRAAFFNTGGKYNNTTTIVGDSGTIFTSSDSCKTWRADTTNTKTNFKAVDYRGDLGRYAAGDSGDFYKSLNGSHVWNKIPTNTRQTLRAFYGETHSQGTWEFVVGDSGVIYFYYEGSASQGRGKAYKLFGQSGIRFTSVQKQQSLNYNFNADGNHNNYPLTQVFLVLTADSGRIYQFRKTTAMALPTLNLYPADSISSSDWTTSLFPGGGYGGGYAFAADGKIAYSDNIAKDTISPFYHVPTACGSQNHYKSVILDPYSAPAYVGGFAFGDSGVGTGWWDHAVTNQNFPLLQQHCFKTGTFQNITASVGFNTAVTNVPKFYMFTDSGYVFSNNPLFFVQPGIKANGQTSFCKGLGSVTLGDTVPSENVDYQWYKNNRIIPGATSKTYTATDTGTYFVKKSIFNGAGTRNYNTLQLITSYATDSNSNRIHVSYLPQPARPVITYTAPNSLNGAVADGVKYVWLRNTTLLPDTTAGIAALASGSYRVIAYNSGGCKSDTSAPFQYVRCTDLNRTLNLSHDTVICAGKSVVFKYTINSGFTGAVYKWYKNGVAVPTGGNASTLTVTDSGQYSILVSLGNCAVYSDTVKVSVLAPPATPSISPSGTISLCSGDSVILSGPAGFSRYTWFNASSNVIKDTVANKFTLKTAITGLKLKVTNGLGCASSFSTPVSLVATTKPHIPTLTQTGTTLTAAVSPAVPGVLYKWFKNGVLVSGQSGATLTNASAGAGYKVVAYLSTCYSDTSATLLVQGLQTLSSGSFTVYPNPNSGSFHIACNAQLTGGSITVSDMAGKEIYSGQITGIHSEILLPETAKGIYILQYSNKNSQTMQKLVIY